MRWPRLKDILIFRHDLTDVQDGVEEFSPEGSPALSLTGSAVQENEGSDSRWRRLRFDNTVRAWVAIPTYLTCMALRAGGAIDSILPMTGVIAAYALTVYATFAFFFNTRFPRMADYVLAGIDLTALSMSVYLTGATASPLYFIYFVPLIVHAFHRDWNLILFTGFGGVIFYGITSFASLSNPSWAVLADVSARLVFMSLTVAVTCLALSVLRREEQRQMERMARLRSGSAVGHRLNSACSTKEIYGACPDIAPLVASALSVKNCEVRIGFRGEPAPGISVAIATSGDTPFGTMSVFTPIAKMLSDDDLRFLRFIASSIALSLRRYAMIEEIGRSLEMATAVAAIYMAADRSGAAAQTSFLDGGLNLCRADGAALLLWNRKGNCPELLAPEGSAMGHDDVVSKAFTQRAVQNENGADGAHTLALPIETVGGELLGVLMLSRHSGVVFSEEEAALAMAYVCRSAHALAPTLRDAMSTLLAPRLAA